MRPVVDRPFLAGEPPVARVRQKGVRPVGHRLSVASIAAPTVALLAVGCSDGTSSQPSTPSTASSDATSSTSTSLAPVSSSTSVLDGVELFGPVTSIASDPPPTLDCYPTSVPDPSALCPLSGVDVLGSVTIAGTLVLVTDETVMLTCGPTDGAVGIDLEDAVDLPNQITSLSASASVVSPPSGGWARASRVFLGSCG